MPIIWGSCSPQMLMMAKPHPLSSVGLQPCINISQRIKQPALHVSLANLWVWHHACVCVCALLYKHQIPWRHPQQELTASRQLLQLPQRLPVLHTEYLQISCQVLTHTIIYAYIYVCIYVGSENEWISINLTSLLAMMEVPWCDGRHVCFAWLVHREKI